MAKRGLPRLELEGVNSTTGFQAAHATPIPVLGTGRSRAIIPGTLAVLQTGGTADGMVQNDTTSDGSNKRLIALYVTKCLDEKGRPVQCGYLGTSTAGFVEGIKVTPDMTFRAVEDGTGGFISGTAGSVQIVTPAIAAPDYTETQSPDMVSSEKIDSSTLNATTTAEAFYIVGLDPEPGNTGTDANGEACAKVFRLKVNSAFISSAI